MSQIINLTLSLEDDLSEELKKRFLSLSDYRILKKSVDARKRNHIKFIYTVEVALENEALSQDEFVLEKLKSFSSPPIIIIGAGPAGLFAALRLLERGIKCIVLEQGEETKKRVVSIAKFWRKGELNPYSNVGFGEGGAGLFSDGKLITRIKSDHIPYVMRRLVEFGAPKEIEYLSNPHVGSDKIRRVIPKIREKILSLGGEIYFNTKVIEILYNGENIRGVSTLHILSKEISVLFSDKVILATGHSSDIFSELYKNSVYMEGKSFAVGFRIEHNQEKINKIQYKNFFNHPKLDAANYKLAYTDKEDGVGVYSFCMCPGGYVLSSGTEEGKLVSNGMSNYNRGSHFANSALVISIDFNEHFGKDLFGGLGFRDEIESKAFHMAKSNKALQELPAQTLSSFLAKKLDKKIEKNSSPSGAIPAPLHELFDDSFNKKFTEALKKFDQKMTGFLDESALLFAVESRTSCPIRISRDNSTLQSLSHKGLYPIGEGAGYAGGITSAACDGVKAADKIYESLK